MDKIKLGIVDTMFSRANMGDMAIDEIKKNYPDVEIVRRTVPGIKDIPVECARIFDEEKCDVCLALGMVGGAPVDEVCAHEASTSLLKVKLDKGKHIIEAFIHENESWTEKELHEIIDNRVRRHAHNAVLVVSKPDELVKNAGKGVRQGKDDEGPLSFDGRKPRISIVVAEFNEEVTSRMLEKAKEVIEEEGAVLGDIVTVSGSFEIPLAVKYLFWDKNNSAVVTLGAILKGDTAHDELIAKTVAKKISDLSLEFRKPVTLGLIGHDAGHEEADERAEVYAERAVKAAINSSKVLLGCR